jgi:citrate lyase gamma subunit
MNITLTKEQENSIVINHREAIAAAIKAAVDKELSSIRNDWKIQDQVQQLVRKQFGDRMNEVIVEKLKDRKLVEELVSEKLTASIKSRLTKQLNALLKIETPTI